MSASINSDDYHLIFSIVQQIFPEGKLDLTKKRIDWESIAAKEGINKKAAEMRWARFKKRNMENGKWVSKEATNGGGAGTEDGGEEHDVNEGTPSKKRKKSQVVKETKKVAKKDVKDGVDDDAEEDDE